jgi:transcription elongation factor Elf1
MSNSIKLKLKKRDFECSICEQVILTTPIINSHNNLNGIYCLDCVGNNQDLYSFYRNTYLEGFIREKCSYDDGLLPWTIKCFFCNENISHSSIINHFKNECEDLNWIQEDDGTKELLNSCILDGDITMKLNDFNQACFILKKTVVMLKRMEGDEWDVAVVGSDCIQLKYSEEMTDTIIKYVLLDIQPKESFKDIDVLSLLIFKGVLRVVVVEDKEDTESINTTQFFLGLVEDIKDREETESHTK